MKGKKSDNIRARLALENSDILVAQKVASVLQKQGFNIVHVANRGVGFEGDTELFSNVFKSEPQKQAEGYSFESEPKLPEEIANVKASVYFPTKPILFK